MATNKKRIESLEVGLISIQVGMQRLEEIVHRLSKLFLTAKDHSNNHNNGQWEFGQTRREESNDNKQIFSSKMAKMEFHKYIGYDHIEWLNRATQFFEYQGTTDDQKLSFVSYHLEREANQWWQWLHHAYQEDSHRVTMKLFEEELVAHFGPMKCEDFDKALSKVQRTGSLHDYQKDFKRLGN